MCLILFKNKKIFDRDVGASLENMFAVIRQNQPWPFGLRLTSLSTRIDAQRIVRLWSSIRTQWIAIVVSNKIISYVTTVSRMTRPWHRWSILLGTIAACLTASHAAAEEASNAETATHLESHVSTPTEAPHREVDEAAEGLPWQTPKKKRAPTPIRAYDTFQLVFQKGEHELSDSAKATLGEVAAALKKDLTLHATLQSYATLQHGPYGGARRLALQRALFARSYLTGTGIAKTRLHVQALGEAAAHAPKDRIDITLRASGIPLP